MDPIHPILPQKVNIPPVTEPPRTGRIDRRDPRENKRDQREKPGSKRQGDQHGDEPQVVRHDQSGPHIDITA